MERPSSPRESDTISGERQFALLLTSFLVGELKYLGPLCSPRGLARDFLRSAGRTREVFLPFFYRWFDGRTWVQDHALRLLLRSIAREGLAPPRVFHAPFAGRHGPYSRGHYRDLTDPRRLREHQAALQQECRFLGRLRREAGIQERMTYVLHLGRRHERTVQEALEVAIAAVEPAVAVAHEEGVVLALENIGEQTGDDESVGNRLMDIEGALNRLGRGQSNAPVGWTFDISHALLVYRREPEALFTDLQCLLPSLVHIHINAPRWVPENLVWADRHQAPADSDRAVWELFRVALGSRRFREFRSITYEVNWAAPALNPLIGGSPLRAVVQGHERVARIATETLGRLDEAPDRRYAVASRDEAAGAGRTGLRAAEVLGATA